MSTEEMRARFIGDESDPGTIGRGIVYNGTYTIKLMHPNWLQKIFGEKGVIAKVRVAGQWHRILYESIKAFDQNWELR